MKKTILIGLMMLAHQAFALPVGSLWVSGYDGEQEKLQVLSGDLVELTMDPNTCRLTDEGDRTDMCSRMIVFTSTHSLVLISDDGSTKLFGLVGSDYRLSYRDKSSAGRPASVRLIYAPEGKSRSVEVLEYQGNTWLRDGKGL